MEQALVDILAERARQNAKWGEQNHDIYIWMAILVEEVGELAEAILHTSMVSPEGGMDKVREETIHVAAVALQIIEFIDRGR